MKSNTIPPLPQAAALLFNISSPQREQKILAMLSSMGITARVIPAAEQLQTLGQLAGIPGNEVSAAAKASQTFTDEMLVMCMFTRPQIDEFLQFFHDNGLNPIALKAVLTPSNSAWSAARLCRELKKEHRNLTKKI